MPYLHGNTWKTYLRNNHLKNYPSADTVFWRIRKIASESGSHRRKGSLELKRGTDHSGIETISELIDRTVKDAKTLGAFMQPVIVAIDEHDPPYYGMDNRYLISALFHKFRGTDRVYRSATLESVKKGEKIHSVGDQEGPARRHGQWKGGSNPSSACHLAWHSHRNCPHGLGLS